MLKPLHRFLLIGVLMSGRVLAGELPIVSGAISETCPNLTFYTIYSSTPYYTYNSAQISFGSGPGRPVVFKYRPNRGTWRYDAIIISGSAGYKTAILSGLTPDTVYEWQIATLCAPNDTSTYAPPLSFITAPCINSAALLTTTNVSSNSATIDWYSSTSFAFQWREVNSPGWTTINPAPSRPFTLTGLTNQTAYEWRVAEVCTPAQSSTYTQPTSFTTACPTPTNLYSTDGSYYLNTTNLRWESAIALPYEVQYQPQNTNPANWTTISDINSTLTPSLHPTEPITGGFGQCVKRGSSQSTPPHNHLQWRVTRRGLIILPLQDIR